MQELINFKDQNLNLDYLTLNIPNSVGRISEFAEIFFRYGFNSKVFYVATNESQTILEDKKLLHTLTFRLESDSWNKETLFIQFSSDNSRYLYFLITNRSFSISQLNCQNIKIGRIDIQYIRPNKTNDIDVDEFLEKSLQEDPRVDDGKYDRISIDEARTIVQGKSENLVIKPTRSDMETARRVDLDYKVQGPAPFTHFDVKNPVGSEILKKQGQTISLEDMSYKIGQKIVAQKHKFVGLENGPVAPENVGHIVDLCYVPSSEKTIVKQNILQGAVDKGSDAGIIFLNDI